MSLTWIIVGLVVAIGAHELAGHYMSGYRTKAQAAGTMVLAIIAWFQEMDWSTILADPNDAFAIMAAVSFVTIYQQIRSQRTKA